MQMKDLELIIEAILFAAGEAVSSEKLTQILEITGAELSEAAKKLASRYDFERRGIMLVRMDNKYQLCSRPEYADYIRKALECRKPPSLSPAALEVLSVIAYRQPVTRAFVEQIRGVDSSNTILSLSEKGLIEECGRLDVPGRPILYRTTPAFLRTFSISNLSELPELPELSGSEGEQLRIQIAEE